jgi:hypothetical protein
MSIGFAGRRKRTLVRGYAGADQHDAVRRFSMDAKALAVDGYRVASYAWTASSRGTSTPAAPGVLARRHGTLTVTYRRGEASADPPADLLTVAPPGVAAELIDLLTARAYGVIDDRQFSAMRKRLVRAT